MCCVHVSKAVSVMQLWKRDSRDEIVCDREDRDVIEDTPEWSREKEHKK